MILFSQYLVGVHIPWLSWKGRRVTMSRLQIFRLFPVGLQFKTIFHFVTVIFSVHTGTSHSNVHVGAVRTPNCFRSTF